MTHNVEIMYEPALASTAEIRHIDLLVVLVFQINLESLLKKVVNVKRILLYGPGEALGEQIGVGQQSLLHAVTAVGHPVRAVIGDAVPAGTESVHLSPRVLFVDVEPTDHADDQDHKGDEKEQQGRSHVQAVDGSPGHQVAANRIALWTRCLRIDLRVIFLLKNKDIWLILQDSTLRDWAFHFLSFCT